MKLFEVCRSRRIPVITVVNKWDRPGLEALELLDEIEARTGSALTRHSSPPARIGRRPTPLTWHRRRLQGRHRSLPVLVCAGAPARGPVEAYELPVDEVELLDIDGYNHDAETFRHQATTPVVFTAAVVNFGVKHLLDILESLAPAPGARTDETGGTRPLTSAFSAQVFKVQAGMDRSHRDRLAFARVCSGVFTRGDVVTQSSTGRSFATKYVHSVFGRDRDTLELAYPGDIIGLVNAGDLRAGDTLYAGPAVTFPQIPPFAPEHFRVIRAADLSRDKQFQRGMDQLDQEGVIQVLRSDKRSRQNPVLAAVGPMQFEVVAHRMQHEFGVPIRLDALPFTVARQTRPQDAATIEQRNGVEVVTRADGAALALFSDAWQVKWVQRDHPDVVLAPITHDITPPGGSPAGAQA